MDTLTRAALLRRAQDFAQQSFNVLHRLPEDRDSVEATLAMQHLRTAVNDLDRIARLWEGANRKRS